MTQSCTPLGQQTFRLADKSVTISSSKETEFDKVSLLWIRSNFLTVKVIKHGSTSPQKTANFSKLRHVSEKHHHLAPLATKWVGSRFAKGRRRLACMILIVFAVLGLWELMGSSDHAILRWSFWGGGIVSQHLPFFIRTTIEMNLMFLSSRQQKTAW